MYVLQSIFAQVTNNVTLQSPFSGSSKVWSIPVLFSRCNMHSSAMAIHRCDSKRFLSRRALQSSKWSSSRFIADISLISWSFQKLTSDRRSPDQTNRAQSINQAHSYKYWVGNGTIQSWSQCHCYSPLETRAEWMISLLWNRGCQSLFSRTI
jgi:hypothetical protein